MVLGKVELEGCIVWCVVECVWCVGCGYDGRLGIFELFFVDE